MKEGQPKREDYHYQRNGTCNVFARLTNARSGLMVHCISTAYWSKDGCGLQQQNPRFVPCTRTPLLQ
jgi:hypothetical protein